jgi:hypothetical protein
VRLAALQMMHCLRPVDATVRYVLAGVAAHMLAQVLRRLNGRRGGLDRGLGIGADRCGRRGRGGVARRGSTANAGPAIRVVASRAAAKFLNMFLSCCLSNGASLRVCRSSGELRMPALNAS